MEIDVHLGGEPALVPFDRLRDVALDERDLLRCIRRSNRQTPEQDCQTCDKSEACPDTSRIPGDLQNKSGGKQRSKREAGDRKSTRLNSSHQCASRMPSSA